METTPSLTNLSEAEWALLQPRLPPDARTGRPRRHDRRSIMNALLYVYVRRTGGAWRLLPTDWPPWQTVSASRSTWRRDGTWKRLHTPRRQRRRLKLGRDPAPSAGSSESPSVKTTSVGGARGDDGAKQRVGRQRQVVVETEGLLLTPERPSGQQHGPRWEQAGARRGPPPPAPRCRACSSCGSTRATTGAGKAKGKDGVEQTVGWRGETVTAVHRSTRYWVPNDLPPEPIDGAQYLPAPGFHVSPRRGVVERTFAWLSHHRRLSTEDERLCATSETWISLALSRLMLSRLARLS